MNELSAIAFGSTERSSTRLTYSVWRNGTSKAATTPAKVASAIRCQTSTQPNQVSTASVVACSASSVWVR